MERTVYGHQALDALLQHHHLARAGGVRPAGFWANLVPLLAKLWHEHLGHDLAGVLVLANHGSLDLAASARLETVERFTAHLAAAVDAVGRVLDTPARREVFGDDPICIRLSMEERVLRDGSGTRYACATVNLPESVTPHIWNGLDVDTRWKTTTTGYAETLRAVRTAWKPLGRTSDLGL